MRTYQHPARAAIAKLYTGLDALLFGLSTYAVPAALALLTALALLSWDNFYSTPNGHELSFQALRTQPGEDWTPQQADQRLREAPTVRFLDTRLSTEPVWIALRLGEQSTAASEVVDFPSRHGTELRCWNRADFRLLGEATRGETSGALGTAKAGFTVRLSATGPVTGLLCRANFVGPARATVLLWAAQDLEASVREFHRNGSFLEGGLIVLALFVLTTALINRNSTYLLFAVWLVVNLRVGALSAGWDLLWLGRAIPPDWLQRGRLLTVAVYYVVTITMFRVLFREDLQKVGNLGLLRFAQWTCLPLLLASATMSYAGYLPYLWASTGLNIGVLVYFMVRILLRTRSPVAVWYSASIAITLFASLYEVLSAALGMRGLIGAINSVTAALSSSLLASLAIAEQMRQEHNQRLQAQAELEHTFEAMPIGLFTLDLAGRFTSANPALRDMLGADVLRFGRSAWHQYFQEGAWGQLHDLVTMHGTGELEIRGRKLLGMDSHKRYLVKAALARDKIEGSLQDVTEKSRATEELQFMADNDVLTKVLNRRGIQKVLQVQLAELDHGRPLALAYLDLDRFKLINDLFGHNAGDEVLQQVCTRITNMLSEPMRVGRVGGDEFLIVMPDTRVPLATLICQGIVASIGGSPYRVGEKAFHVRGSIGLIEVRAGTRMKDAVATADRACREAKAGHSDGLVVYEKSAKAFHEHEAEMQLVEHLSTAAATDGLYLDMQPIMALAAPQASLNFEVLLRMRNAEGKLVPTDRVVAAGENSGRMGVIDRWVLSATLSWLGQNIDQLRHTRFVCMNLSGASLNDEKFMQEVYTMLSQNIQLAGLLCFEITESVALHDLDNTRRFIDTVRSYGAKVALDDFGAGYTSFSYLKELPADLLKIDGSFIVNMNKHPANVAIVEAIVNLAQNLGMKTVAEWAEDLGTVRTLAEIGVDYVQGYAICRPIPPDRLLNATSAASFIQDEDTARYVRLLERAEGAVGGDTLRLNPLPDDSMPDPLRPDDSMPDPLRPNDSLQPSRVRKLH